MSSTPPNLHAAAAAQLRIEAGSGTDADMAELNVYWMHCIMHETCTAKDIEPLRQSLMAKVKHADDRTKPAAER